MDEKFLAIVLWRSKRDDGMSALADISGATYLYFDFSRGNRVCSPGMLEPNSYAEFTIHFDDRISVGYTVTSVVPYTGEVSSDDAAALNQCWIKYLDGQKAGRAKKIEEAFRLSEVTPLKNRWADDAK